MKIGNQQASNTIKKLTLAQHSAFLKKPNKMDGFGEVKNYS